MNTGKTLFSQLMDFLPWSTFIRIVARYHGDDRVRTLSCAEQYRAMAFAQLTYRESLRDIETCLSVQASKLYHMGFRDPVRRSTLADANESRDWRIYADLAQRLIVQARKLYANEDLGVSPSDIKSLQERKQRSACSNSPDASFTRGCLRGEQFRRGGSEKLSTAAPHHQPPKPTPGCEHHDRSQWGRLHPTVRCQRAQATREHSVK